GDDSGDETSRPPRGGDPEGGLRKSADILPAMLPLAGMGAGRSHAKTQRRKEATRKVSNKVGDEFRLFFFATLRLCVRLLCFFWVSKPPATRPPPLSSATSGASSPTSLLHRPNYTSRSAASFPRSPPAPTCSS